MKFACPDLDTIYNVLINDGHLPIYKKVRNCAVVFDLIKICIFLRPDIDWYYTPVEELQQFYKLHKAPSCFTAIVQALYKPTYTSLYENYCALVDHARKITEEEQKIDSH